MQKINGNGYSIYFEKYGYQALNEIIAKNKYSSLFILTDENAHDCCISHFLSQLETDLKIEIIEIEAGEALKNISSCVEIWTILTEFNADRKSLILNLGGGVITDLGGFVASTFKRGIDFINIPTTLLAMVDASIGGKNGVDLGSLKNQIGVIKNPELVLIDIAFLKTLPQNQLTSGWAEMLKHGLIFDHEYWTAVQNINFNDQAQLNHMIYRSVAIKNQIVNQDPTENGIRKSLNFGHTLGHAIESHFLETPTPLLHGEAIGIGMILESFLSKEKKLLSENDYQTIKKVLKSIFAAVEFSVTDCDCIMNLLIHDKKNEYGQVQFVLLASIGSVALNQTIDNELIAKAFADYKI